MYREGYGPDPGAEFIGELVLRMVHVHRGTELFDEQKGLLFGVIEENRDTVVTLDRFPYPTAAVLDITDLNGFDVLVVLQGRNGEFGYFKGHARLFAIK